jgi:endonuclease YncB( thermonuclease family)
LNLFRTTIVQALAATLLCWSSHAYSAKTKEWVRLTDCQYVAQAYNDGDSFHVRCGADELIVRLYFVDAPEASLQNPERVREQSEYFGVTLDETLRAGKQATVAVQEILQTPFVVWTRWASAQGRTKISRYYAFVEVGTQSLADLLVSKGLARIKGITAKSPLGVPSQTTLEKLRALEHEAQQQRRGAWATSSGGAMQSPP